MSVKPSRAEWDYEKNFTVVRVMDLVRSKILGDVDALNVLALESCLGSGRRSMSYYANVQSSNGASPPTDLNVKLLGLPQAEWLAGFRQDTLRIRLTLNKLESLCLLTTKRDHNNLPVEVSVHNMISSWGLHRLEKVARQNWVVLAAYLVSLELKKRPKNSKGHVPHLPWVKHCWENINKHVEPEELMSPQGKFCASFAFIARTFGNFYLECGSLGEAEPLLIAAMDHQRIVQGLSWPCDPESLELMKEVSRVWKRLGKLEEAAEILGTIHQRGQDILDDTDDLILWSGGQLRDIRETKNAFANSRGRAIGRTAHPVGERDMQQLQSKPMISKPVDTEITSQKQSDSGPLDLSSQSDPEMHSEYMATSEIWSQPLLDIERALVGAAVSRRSYQDLENGQHYQALQNLEMFYYRVNMYAEDDRIEDDRNTFEDDIINITRDDLASSHNIVPQSPESEQFLQEMLNARLMVSAKLRDVDKCENLLVLGARADLRHAPSQTFFGHAVERGAVRTARWCLENACNFQAEATNLNESFCRLVLDFDLANIGATDHLPRRQEVQEILFLTRAYEYFETSKIECESPWKRNFFTAAHLFDTGRIELLLENDEQLIENLNSDIFRIASIAGSFKAICTMIRASRHSGILNKYVIFSGLVIASFFGYRAIVELLLSNYPTLLRTSQIYYGKMDPLYAASIYGEVKIVRLLLENGANANSVMPHYGLTPLYAASYHGHVDVVQLLINHGAQVDQAIGSSTPKHVYDHRFPLGIAKERDNDAVVEILRKHLPRENPV